MPINAFRRDGDFGHQVRAREGYALQREAAQRDAANHAIFFGDLLRIEEFAKLAGLRISGYRRGQSHPKTFCASARYARPGTRPGALTTMRVVALRCGAVEAYLNCYSIAWQREQSRE